ncbi:SNF2 family N-terminal domain-containing protein [Chlamydoabsidia padenii]|nr:SNF2 family N-terminal domain-containing protein [Chlamydoabsidia padenii]
MHKHEDFVCLLTRLCAISPDEWRPKVTYYVYVDIGGLYYPIESASWVRDKDHLLVTTVEDVSDIPDIDMNAVHARLRDGTQLLPHQEEGVRRMIEMEQTETRGGILADEMGLGKTLQVLTMMIRQQPKLDIQAKTLVVVPSHGVADLWAEEIRLKTRFGALPYFIYDDHTKFLIEQPCFKVIIVTYDRLRSEYYRLYVNNQTSPLFDTHWFRVVLDECNKLHDNKSKLTGAVLGLDTSFRWCLTGTPLQNNTIELLPIFKFLNIDLPPLAKRHESKCYADILAKHMIRRKVDQLSTKSLMKQKTEIRVVLKFTPPERALYDYLETILYKQLQNDQKRRQIKGGNPGLNVLYLRLKQVCNHHLILLNKFPDLIPMAKTQSEEQVANAIQNSNVPGVNSRSVEGQQLNSELDQVRNLIKDFYNQNTAGVIPTPNMEDLEKLPFIRQSTKVSWLITFLNESIENSSSDKIIVVSQFAELLMIISDLLKQIKLKHECYTGDMKPFHRKQSLERFQTNPKCQILLLSLKAGGVGLNLQCANHMVLLDQWWNPGK